MLTEEQCKLLEACQTLNDIRLNFEEFGVTESVAKLICSDATLGPLLKGHPIEEYDSVLGTLEDACVESLVKDNVSCSQESLGGLAILAGAYVLAMATFLALAKLTTTMTDHKQNDLLKDADLSKLKDDAHINTTQKAHFIEYTVCMKRLAEHRKCIDAIKTFVQAPSNGLKFDLDIFIEHPLEYTSSSEDADPIEHMTIVDANWTIPNIRTGRAAYFQFDGVVHNIATMASEMIRALKWEKENDDKPSPEKGEQYARLQHTLRGIKEYATADLPDDLESIRRSIYLAIKMRS